MFEPLTISHDQCLEKIFEILPGIADGQVAKAFLSSLTSRRLDWRSGLASYFIARQLTPHTYNKAVADIIILTKKVRLQVILGAPEEM